MSTSNSDFTLAAADAGDLIEAANNLVEVVVDIESRHTEGVVVDILTDLQAKKKRKTRASRSRSRSRSRSPRPKIGKKKRKQKSRSRSRSRSRSLSPPRRQTRSVTRQVALTAASATTPAQKATSETFQQKKHKRNKNAPITE